MNKIKQKTTTLYGSMEKSVLLVDDKQEIAKIIMLYLSSTYKVSYKEIL